MSDSADEPAPPEEDGGETSPLAFEPVALRYRHDGWTVQRQEDFIRALAASGCVEESVRRVGKSASSAYDLRARPEAHSFRRAWDAAIDMAMPRMSDAAISRSIHGVPVPHYYKGELVGEHRRYDERLTMWLLRYRHPERYGKWLDGMEFTQPPEARASRFRDRLLELWANAYGLLTGKSRGEDSDGKDESSG
jgi:hypothetical protein